MREIAQYTNEYEVHTGTPQYEYLSFEGGTPTQTGVDWTFDSGYDEEHEAVQRVAEIRREHQYVRIVRRETD